jgi:hypothetical protein
MVRNWAGARDDVLFQGPAERAVAPAPIVAIDQLGIDNTADIIAEIRAADDAKAATRFVLVPADLKVFRALQNALVGFVQPVEILPLQLDEYLADQMPLAETMGPQAGMQLAPEATNSSAPDLDRHWLFGGLPESLAFDSIHGSLAWRLAMIDGLLARDYSDFRVTTASRLPELLRWIANQNGGEFDEDSCHLLKKPELRSAIHVLERIGLVRRLSNYPVGSNASMSRKPKLYIRDSGLLHALLGIETIEQLRAHKDAGDSWEGYASEAIIAASGGDAAIQFYRANGPAGEDEIDLVLDFSVKGGPILAVEFKLNPNEGPRPGYFRASAVMGTKDGFIVHAGDTSRLDTGVDRLTLLAALQRVREVRYNLRSKPEIAGL